jgi:hypothetical protein
MCVTPGAEEEIQHLNPFRHDLDAIGQALSSSEAQHLRQIVGMVFHEQGVDGTHLTLLRPAMAP